MMWIRQVAAVAATAGLALAAAWSLRVACADRAMGKFTEAALQSALGWTPDQAECYWRLGVLRAEDPAGGIEALQRAVALNPWNGQAWIDLGLRQEAGGDMVAAERSLLEAADRDRQYLPRWTLANYYLRRGNLAQFWQWTGEAAEMLYGDGTALFRLCGGVTEDGRLVERLPIRRPEVRAGYVSYLLNGGRGDLILPGARAVLAGGREEDVPLLLSVCDRLLERANPAGALEIWNGLAKRRLVVLPELAPAEGRILTNGEFGSVPLSHGFDWRMPETEGVGVSREDAAGGLRITLSGNQPEQCDLAVQLVPMPRSVDLRLAFTYRTEEIAAGTGVAWRITDAVRGGTLLETESLSSDQEARRSFRFARPAECRLARVALTYRRASGTTRVRGYVVLRMVELTAD